MEYNPFFSIIIPSYNRAQLLPIAIASVLNQTFHSWELIIVDDGSTDNTKEIVNGFNDKKIHYFYQKNQERSSARNNGIIKATGKYICFLDSDDYYAPHRLELLYKEITNRNCPKSIFYTDISFNYNGIITNKKHSPLKQHTSIYDYLCTELIGVPQVSIEKSIFSHYQFNPTFSIGEDLELWLRIATTNSFEYIPNQFTVIATEHENRSTNEKKNNSGLLQLKLFKYIFKHTHSGNFISTALKKAMLADSYFKIAKHFMYNNKKLKSIYWLLKALISKPNHEQKNHWLHCIYSLLLGSIPKEYR